jgi:pimeloyl-ACP methyl ester carboxylesterase
MAWRQFCRCIAGAALVACAACIPNPAASRPEWRRLTRAPGDFDLMADTVSFTTADSLRLRAWWIPATGRAPATVVLAHGSGSNRSGMLSRAAFLVRAGFNVLDVDLRAHGESEGPFMTPGWREADDIRAAVAWLRARDSTTPILVLGHSYGAVAALHAGRDPDLAAVIADAPFKSYDAMMKNARAAMKGDPRVTRSQRIGMALVDVPGLRQFVGWSMRRRGVVVPADSAPATFAVMRLRTSVLFIAGEKDPIAPAADIRLLHDSARSSHKGFVELPGATHRTFGDAPKEYERAVLDFVRDVLARQRTRLSGDVELTAADDTFS